MSSQDVRRSILFSFAHPDDETFLTGGIARRYADQGVSIALLTATLGEAGKCGDPPVCTREELPQARRAELWAAASMLGYGEPALLGYRDRELANAPVNEIREKLVTLIRRHRPQVVVTFDPNGSNFHPDHIAISRFTSDAVVAAADPRWFPAAGPAHAVQRLVWTPPARPWLFARMETPAAEPGVDFVFDIAPWAAVKKAALRVHRTQHLNVERVFFSQPDADRLLSLEVLRQAFGPPLESRPATDLFAGIDHQ
ncbi:MAG: PIG-L deacetylase family protein [Bacteroidales bacterium]